jgi:hypothetical protein
MKERRAFSYKTTAAVFAFIAVTVINIQSLLFPIFASYGGQWARVRNEGMFGWGDKAFYPQTELFPFDIILYIASMTILAVMALKWLAKMQSRKLLKMYVAIASLPFAWAALNFFIGFDYSKCNLPSEYYICENPAERIWQRLILHLTIIVATLALIAVVKMINNRKSIK